MISPVLAIFIVTIILVISIFRRRPNTSPYPTPPGPRQLPLLGNLLDVDKERVHLAYFKWAKIYGPIFACKLFRVNAIVLNKGELVRKAYGSEEFADFLNDRPESFMGQYIAYNYSDTIFARYNQTSRDTRKIIRHCLHRYGDGTDRFESTVQAELRRLLEVIRNKDGHDFDPRPVMERSTADLISFMMIGTGISDEVYEHVWTFQHWANTLLGPSNELTLYNFPWLRFLPGKYGHMYRTAQSSKAKIMDFLFERQKATYSPGIERGFIDIFLKNQEEECDWLTDDHIRGLVIDSVGAASITLANATLGVLLMLLNHPDCQERMFRDIEAHVGLSRLPVQSDMAALPYCEAAILESLRLSSHVPVIFPHRCMKDLVFEGYSVPKDTWIFANLWKIHHDEEVFEDPWKFKPERLLDENGKLLSPNHPVRQSILTFSTGRRMCLGENVARVRMFLYLSALVQNFRFLPPAEGALPEADPHNFAPGIILKPMSYRCRAVLRC